MAGLPVYVRLEVSSTYKAGGRGGGGVGFGPVHSKLVLNEKGLDEWKKREGGEKQSEDPSNNLPQCTDTSGASAESKGIVLSEQKLSENDTAPPSTFFGSSAVPSGSGDANSDAETYVQFRRRIALEEKKEFITKVQQMSWLRSAC